MFWTVVRGEMWVACQAECTEDQIDLFGSVTPPVIALCSEPESGLGTLADWVGKETPEGGAASANHHQDQHELPF